MRQLEEIFEMAVDRGGTEVILETGQPALVTTPRGGEPVGNEIDEGTLFEILMGALSEEQQVELAVGNVIEFSVTTKHGDWAVVAEPGADGMSVRARRGGAHTSARREGVHLPPATPYEIDDDDSLPPGAEPSMFAAPSERTPTPPSVGGDPFDTPAEIRGAARGPLDLPPEPPEELEVSVEEEEERSPFDAVHDAPELAPEGLDFDPDLRSSSQDEPTIETATVAPPAFSPPPPTIGQDAFEPPPQPSSATRPTPREIPVASGREDKATVTDHPAHRSSSTMMGISVPPSTGEVPAAGGGRPRTQDLPAAGSLTLTLGHDIARLVAEAEGKTVRLATTADHLRAMADAHHGDVLVLRFEDPSVHLGWALRRVEEGHTVMVETRATTPGGARRTLLGVGASARAETWLDFHGCETLAFEGDEIVVLGD